MINLAAELELRLDALDGVAVFESRGLVMRVRASFISVQIFTTVSDKHKKKMAQLYKEIEATLRRNGTYEDELRGETLASQIHEGFKDKEAEKLRGQYIQLNMFN